MSGRWSDRVKWIGGEDIPPMLSPGENILVEHRDGDVINTHVGEGAASRWNHCGTHGDIVAFYYWIEDDKEQKETSDELLSPASFGAVGDGLHGLADDTESVMHIFKQTRYLDSRGDDWIDEFARTATVDEFRGAMKFTIGKYLRRIGKKDDIPQELGKIRDYAERWKEYERNL